MKTNETTTATFSKNIQFTDADGQTVFVTIEVKDGKLSMCGNIAGGGGGQCQDSISPANEAQKELIDIWNTWHLNDMKAGAPEQEEALNSKEFEEFKQNIADLIDKAKTIESIINGPFAKYCEFVGIPSSYASAKHDQRNLQKVWRGEPVLITKPYKQTKSLKDVINSIPVKMRPDFKWNSYVPPNKVKDLFDSSYTIKCEFLKSKSLYSVQYMGAAYEYGTAWLTHELPANIIERLETICANIGGEFTGSPYEKQANDLLQKMGVTFSAVYKDHAKYFQDDDQARDIYKVKLSRGRNSFSITFGQSIASAGTPPTAYDVLACLTKSDPGDLTEFCSNYGYDADSRKAEKIYKSVCAEWAKVNAFFTDEEIEELQNIA